MSSRKRKRKRDAEPTSLMSLGDDMLVEVLTRLPSLPSLASAGLASPRLCAVASSPAVVDPFLSRAPLLGYFVSVPRGAVPAFHRAVLRGDRHLAAVVRRGDFHLADFEEYKWRLMDCRHGLLLLSSDSWRCSDMVVFDPVSHSRLRIPHCPHKISSESLNCFLPAGGSGPTSFRVLSLEKQYTSVLACVYSSRTGEWGAPKSINRPRGFKLGVPMHAGGRIYWRCCRAQLTSLDVGAMKFSPVALPNKHFDPRSYAVGETEDGTTCLVAMEHSLVRIWFLKEDKFWELQSEVDAFRCDRGVQKICDVTAGVVLVIAMGTSNGALHYYAFRLKNALENLEADFFTSSGSVLPYFMTWPRPSLKVGTDENTATRGQQLAGKKTSLKDQ
ncbi:hypothetical protein ZWY2020_041761 [Hordeum vulgare]|nr:hypothetical protein ZWY2020_041761 [Hordeum vulgare]